MNGFLRAAMYARVSSQKQADEMTILSQREDILKRIQSDQLTLGKGFEFCDDGYSGTDMMRPALEELRDRVAASLIERLYVHSPDRLARNFAHQAILLEEFQKHDCKVIFLNQEGLPQTPETNLLLQMQGMIAEYERDGNVSVFSGAPYGYRYISRANGDGQARWEIHEQEGEAVRLMFNLYGQQNVTLGAVCRELRAREILTRTGKTQWDGATIRGILRNPAYYGEAHYGRTRLSQRKSSKRAKRGDPAMPRRSKVSVTTSAEDQVIIPVPALIGKTLFEEVGKRMDENWKHQRARENGTTYLLSGLLICGECGSAFCARRQGSGKHLYYRCIGTDKHRHGGEAICANGPVNGDALEHHVWTELCKLLQNPQQLEAELERRQSDLSPTRSQLTEVEQRVSDLRGRLDRLIDAYSSGHLLKEEFETRITPLRDRHDREVSALAGLRGQLSNPSDASSARATLERLATQVGEQLETASDDLKRELAVLLIQRIEIHKEEIRLVYKVPTNPFVVSPDNRGELQHRLQCQMVARGECLRGTSKRVTPGSRSTRGSSRSTPGGRGVTRPCSTEPRRWR